MKCFIVILSITVAIQAARYELIPVVEYDGELYIPLAHQSRVVRAADPRRGYGGSQADASAAANSQTQTGGFAGRPYGGGYGGKGGFGPGGYGGSGGKGGFGPGGFGGSNSNAGAKAGASGGGSGNSDATANAQSQTFTGNGFSGSASSASASSHSSSLGGGGRYNGGGAGSNAAATADSASHS